MEGSAAEAINGAINAYVAGEWEELSAWLAGDVSVHGSQQLDHFGNKDEVGRGLAKELVRHQKEGNVTGSLVEERVNGDEVNVSGEFAWFSRTGTLTIDGKYFPDTSWTAVLKYDGEGWRIVHSHFSIHHP